MPSPVKSVKQDVTSLFTSCINFVASHLDLVEDFIGFPSQVGLMIFKAAQDGGQFTDNKNLTKFVKLFAEAFCEDFLKQINLSGEYLGLNYYIDSIVMFQDLVQLDVSHCGLGDDHEILSNLAHLNSLEVLYLDHNCITDQGIQKMTAPYRMFHRGPAHLKSLSLCGNVDLTANSLKYVVLFTELTSVDVTGCHNFKRGQAGCWSIQEVDTVDRVKVFNDGWAADVVSNWMQAARQLTLKQPKQLAVFFQRPSQMVAIVADKDKKEKDRAEMGTSKCLVALRLVTNSVTAAAVSCTQPCMQSRPQKVRLSPFFHSTESLPFTKTTQSNPLNKSLQSVSGCDDKSVASKDDVQELMAIYQSGHSKASVNHGDNGSQFLVQLEQQHTATSSKSGQTTVSKVIKSITCKRFLANCKKEDSENVKGNQSVNSKADKGRKLADNTSGSFIQRMKNQGTLKDYFHHPGYKDRISKDESCCSKSSNKLNNCACRKSDKENLLTVPISSHNSYAISDCDNKNLVINPQNAKSTKCTESLKPGTEQSNCPKRKKIRLIRSSLSMSDCDMVSQQDTGLVFTDISGHSKRGQKVGHDGYTGREDVEEGRKVKRQKTGSLLSALDSYM